MYVAVQAAALTAALLSHHGHVTVAPGDTLSQIAATQCGTAAAYPDLAAASGIADPDRIYPGQRITVTCHPVTTQTAYTGHHRGSAANGGGGYGHPNYCGDGDGDGWDMPCSMLGRHDTAASSPATRPRYAARHARTSGTVTPGSSFEACVIARESGGNSQVMNSSGHYGLYQFSRSTWEAYGGSPGSFGNATAAEQRRVFLTAIAQGGQSNWSPYDGC